MSSAQQPTAGNCWCLNTRATPVCRCRPARWKLQSRLRPRSGGSCPRKRARKLSRWRRWPSWPRRPRPNVSRLSATSKFAEKYLLAHETAIKAHFKGGTAGLELEWNMYDSSFKPVLTVGSGPDQQSFMDYLRERVIPGWLEDRNQLEVFHWMIEWATRPYYSLPGAAYEARLLAAFLSNPPPPPPPDFPHRLSPS